ncbi:MAG TPA: hypothetical protein VIY28_02540 [Pseudonocardiaceae bacterium]
MRASSTTQQDLSIAVDALVADLMGDTPPAEITAMVDRLEVILSQGGEMPAALITELRSAVELVRSGQSCPAVSALLAARSELARRPH